MHRLLTGILLLVVADQVNAGCKAARRCCPGKESNCFGYGPRINGQGDSSSRCFCDENCQSLQDCCDDIQEACPAQDCEVSDWSSWSRCHCNTRRMKRSRKITKTPMFGGGECPELHETKRCACNNRPTRNLGRRHRKGMALIMPATFGMIRFNKKQHFNYNLHRHFGNIVPGNSTCAHYEVVFQGRSCSAAWTRTLKPGRQVCVECHPNNMKRSLGYRCNGEGIEKMLTEWTAMRVRGCHGAWRLLEKPKECSCGSRPTDFIFV